MTPGLGGMPGAGGNVGQGGSGGVPATGGNVSATGGEAMMTGGSAPLMGVPGEFTVDVSLSEKMKTVAIVNWTLGQEVQSAEIHFGTDAGNLDKVAPVDLSETNFRTLLLGMKQNTTYSFQIFAVSGGTTYESEVLEITTEALAATLPELTVIDTDASKLYGGFTINCTGVGGIGGGNVAGTAFIFDRDGDMVWAYPLEDTAVNGCSRARMSIDGKYMWVGNFSNVSPDGALVRVTMDGLSESAPYDFPGRHHDFAILPNDHVLIFEQENGGGYADGSEGPDIISDMDPETGIATELYHQSTDFTAQIEDSNGAHTNHIAFVPELNAISFSMRHSSTVALISYPDSQVLGVFSGIGDEFGMSWDVQHGHHVQDGKLLVFNNNGTNGGSSILEYDFDLQAKTSSELPDYSSGENSGAFGDVKRLPNGNIFVTYSTSGVIHEIDADKNLLRSIETDAIGYSEHRGSLYGPPPPFDQ